MAPRIDWPNERIKQKWSGAMRWYDLWQDVIDEVTISEGIAVPIEHAIIKSGIETGYTFDPDIVSRGVNSPCPRVGVDCAPDLRAHGLFQIWWPPERGVNWNRIHDPRYNSEIGIRTLAYYKEKCPESWIAANLAMWDGSCVDIGAVDEDTGTTRATYLRAINEGLDELAQIGIGGGKRPGKDDPPDRGDGNGGNIIDRVKDGIESAAKAAAIEKYIRTGILAAVGLLILILGLVVILR